VNVPSIHYAIAKVLMGELEKRMGNLRLDSSSSNYGAWARAFAKNLDVSDTIDSRMNLYGFEAGFDKIVYQDALQRVYAGFMAGYAYADKIKTKQSGDGVGKGDAKTPSVGIYASWFNKAGWYVDATLRYFWSKMDAKNYTAQGQEISYDADRNMIGVTAEVGKRFEFSPQNRRLYFVEPKAVLQYLYAGSDNYKTNTGNKIHYGKTQGITGKAGAAVGFTQPVAGSVILSPYVEALVGYEFDGETDITYAGGDFKSDLSGMTYEFTLGLDAKVSNQWSLYTYGSYETGATYKGFGGQVGARYAF
jgi:outer membrane autotransporter protein